MKYYIIAGEASGDLHASNLLKELKKLDPSAEFRGWGGDKMAAQGTTIVKHYKDLAFMGFIEVALNIITILKNLRFCKKDIMEFNPDAVILIDYPGFNLQILKFLHSRKVKTIYYIAPQVWAWKRSRVYTIKKMVDKLIVILPFEKDFFKQYGVDAEYVGHPLLDALPDYVSSYDSKFNQKPLVLLMPGSRKQEIRKTLPVMLQLVDDFPEAVFAIAGLSSIGTRYYKKFIKRLLVRVYIDETYKMLDICHVALVASGTATLETAIIGVPQAVVFKADPISFAIAKRLVKVKYISLVNLIMDKSVVAEIIQDKLTAPNLRGALDRLLFNRQYSDKILDDYTELRKVLGGRGASARAAASIYNFLTLPESTIKQHVI